MLVYNVNDRVNVNIEKFVLTFCSLFSVSPQASTIAVCRQTKAKNNGMTTEISILGVQLHGTQTNYSIGINSQF